MRLNKEQQEVLKKWLYNQAYSGSEHTHNEDYLSLPEMEKYLFKAINNILKGRLP